MTTAAAAVLPGKCMPAGLHGAGSLRGFYKFVRYLEVEQGPTYAVRTSCAGLGALGSKKGRGYKLGASFF